MSGSWANLSAIKTSMVLNIRSNLHADNYESYGKLQAAIGAIAKSTGNEMRCSPALVHTSAAGLQRGDPTSHLPSGEYHKILDTTDLEERSNTYTPKLFNCHVVQLDNYLVDDEGYLFPHCNELAANHDFAYGNILDLDEDGLGRLDQLHRAKCLEYVLPTKDEQCMQCELLTVFLLQCRPRPKREPARRRARRAVGDYDPKAASFHVIESKVSLRRCLRQDSWVSAGKLSSGYTCVDWYVLFSKRTFCQPFSMTQVPT